METVVLVLTDVQGSTRLWQDEPEAMNVAMRRHHEIIHEVFQTHGGWRPLDQGEGDAVFAAFRSPTAALTAVVAVQRQLASQAWPTSVPLAVRIGVHVGEAIERNGNLFGEVVNRCARIRGLASGGQTLVSAPMYELVRDRMPVGTRARDLGEHRMKDLTRPERVTQIDIDDLPTNFPALNSLDRLRHNLPVQASSFVGREAELARLVSSMREHRLVTVTGFGGMGKTRLALQAAAELAGERLDGQPTDAYLIDLSAETDPKLVMSRITEEVDVNIGARSPLDALVDAFRGRSVLLVLDNLEQILDCAPSISALLSKAPALRVLATSREPLRIRGEHQHPLEPLTMPTPNASVELLSTFEAVRLFVERAVAVRPNFIVDNTNAPAVAAICTRLDGHPLALELAAAWVKILTPDKLLARLDTALSMLVGGARDSPARHRTLRATIEWSVDSLNADERELLFRLSMLPASADFELIEQVCCHDLDGLNLLEGLVEKSLVRAADVDGQTRFGLLVSIRDFAAEQLTETRRHSLQSRHADAIHDLFVRAEYDDDFTAIVARELAHFRAALLYLQKSGSVQAEVALVLSSWDCLPHLGHGREYLTLSDRVLSLTDDPAAIAQIRLARGSVMMVLRMPGCSEENRLAHDAARQSDDPLMRAWTTLGVMDYSFTSREEVLSSAAEIEDCLPELSIDDRGLIVDSLDHCLAKTLRTAAPNLAEAAARRLISRKPSGIGNALLAALLLDRGEATPAQRALAAIGDPAGLGHYYEILIHSTSALIHTQLADFDAARKDANRAIALSEETGGPSYLDRLAAVEMAAGDTTRANELLEHYPIPAAGDLSADEAQIAWKRAVTLRKTGNSSQAAAELDRAMPILASDSLRLGLDLLAAGTERAAQVLDLDPARAARILGIVDAHRDDLILPFSMNNEADRLRAALLPRYQADYQDGRSLEPTGASW